MKELIAKVPKVLYTPIMTEGPSGDDTPHRLIFSTNSDYLFYLALDMKLHKKSVQECQNHFCIKVYKKNLDAVKELQNSEEKWLEEILKELDQAHADQYGYNATRGIPN